MSLTNEATSRFCILSVNLIINGKISVRFWLIIMMIMILQMIIVTIVIIMTIKILMIIKVLIIIIK